jgi:hypothetical protein
VILWANDINHTTRNYNATPNAATTTTTITTATPSFNL